MADLPPFYPLFFVPTLTPLPSSSKCKPIPPDNDYTLKNTKRWKQDVFCFLSF